MSQTRPEENLKTIVDQFQQTLSVVFGLNPEELGINVLYRITGGSKWKVVATSNIENEMSISQLTSDHTTTAYNIIIGDKNTIFYADKNEGHRQKKYRYGSKDSGKGTIGSVICHNVSIRSTALYVQGVLSITTYGNQICEDSDIESKEKLIQHILPAMATRIQLELSVLYITKRKPCGLIEKR